MNDFSAEIALSIMAACLPGIRRFLGQHFPAHWRFWQRDDDETPDLILDGGQPITAITNGPPMRMRQASVCVDVKPVSMQKPTWEHLDRLEENQATGDASPDETTHDEKNKEISIEHASERYSERDTSPRSSARLSWS